MVGIEHTFYKNANIFDLMTNSMSTEDSNIKTERPQQKLFQIFTHIKKVHVTPEPQFTLHIFN